MRRASMLAAMVASWVAGSVTAGMMEVTATQTGGFYDDGLAPDNSPAFQNYFVGYGTSPGTPRTPERRSFFVFDLSSVTSGDVESAELILRLPFGGLIFGKSGDPVSGPVPSPDDLFEEFALGVTTVPTEAVLSSILTPPEIEFIFESFNDIAVASPVMFSPGSVPPPELDGFGAKIVIPLNAMGISALNFKAGGTIVLTGWMPSWTFDTRMAPGTVPPELYEGSELLFGLTDVHFPPPPGVPAPLLRISLSEPTAIPEPSSLVLLGVGAVGLISPLLRRRRSGAWHG